MNTRQQLNILLIEDEAADAYLTRKALEKGGCSFDLHHVSDGIAALDFLRGHHPDELKTWPDLILLDLNMPRMDGRQFLSQIKQDPQLRGIPVIILSTSDSERDIRHCYDLFASGYLVKPGDIDIFSRLMQGLDHYWGRSVRLPIQCHT